MDLLQEYNKSQLKAQPQSILPTQEQLLQQRYAPDTGFFIPLVIKLSGGRIRDAKQATYVLLGIAGVVFIISLFLIFSGGSAELLPENLPTNMTGSAGKQ
jgi:hypothetical protein